MISVVNYHMQKHLWVVLCLLGLTTACKGPTIIHKDGLAFVEIGDPMPAQDLEWFYGFPIEDTLFSADGFQWQGANIQLDSGLVVLESDFEGNGIVNRIRVESATLKTRKKLKVGMQVSDLMQKGKRWQIYYLENYQLLDVSAKRHPSIHYLVREPKIEAARLKDPGLQLEDLSPEASIVAIVVM